MGKNFEYSNEEGKDGTVFNLKRYGVKGYDYDTVVKPESNGRDYEMHCFKTIARELGGNKVLLGPNIIDYSFANSPLRRLFRPDMLLFDVRQNDLWELRALIECKNSRKLDVPNKLSGFEELVYELRNKRKILSQTLQTFTFLKIKLYLYIF